MTTCESIMLSLCSGVATGTVIANLIIIIQSAIEKLREKRKKKKQAENDLPEEN